MPRNIDREIVEIMHRTHIGADQDYKNLMKQGTRAAIACAMEGLLTPESARVFCGPGLAEVCETVGIPPVLHLGSCVDNSRILLAATEVVKVGGFGNDISELTAAGSAPEWMSEKAISIGHYFVAPGVYTVFGVTLPVSGAPVFQKYIFEEFEKLYGGMWDLEIDPVKHARKMIAHIDDCIEFNDRLRYADITSDLAFLAMDLDFEGHPQIAQRLINFYLDYAKDEEMFILLDFYKCYRAYVRVKVNCFRLRDNDLAARRRAKILKETRRYLNLAYRYVIQFTRPTIWVVCGLATAGKRATAEMTAKILSLGILQSDVVRKKLFNLPLDGTPDLPFEEGIYSKESTALVYGKLLMLAQEEIKQGRSIILDAAFSRRHHRDETLRLARDMDANIIFMECTASNETLKKRLSIRDVSTKNSDLRQQHFKQLCARFESLQELPDEIHIRIDTDLPLVESLRQILAHDYALLAHQTAVANKHWEAGSLNEG